MPLVSVWWPIMWPRKAPVGWPTPACRRTNLVSLANSIRHFPWKSHRVRQNRTLAVILPRTFSPPIPCEVSLSDRLYPCCSIKQELPSCASRGSVSLASWSHRVNAPFECLNALEWWQQRWTPPESWDVQQHHCHHGVCASADAVWAGQPTLLLSCANCSWVMVASVTLSCLSGRNLAVLPNNIEWLLLLA